MLVAFDLEGTLLDGEFFPEIGKALEKERALLRITNQGMNGYLGFEESLYRRFEMVRGMTITEIEDVCRGIPLVKGARETVDSLRELGCIMAIISGGFEVLADRVSKELQIGIVCANRFVVRDGVVDGIRRPIVSPRLKSDLMANIAGQLGFEMRECVAVGDGANDLPMMESAGLSIAFNAKKVVRGKADVTVDSEDLRNILPFIMVFKGKGDKKRN